MIIGSCKNLEFLMKTYYDPTTYKSVGNSSLVDDLVEEEMVTYQTQGDLCKITEKGKFYLEYLLNTPFPETQYIIPDRDKQ